MSLENISSGFPSEGKEVMKEEWDYDKFVKIYNKIAASKWWYKYIPDDPDLSIQNTKLEARYSENNFCQTVRQFAQAVYNNEQAYDDLAAKYIPPFDWNFWWYFD